MLERQIKVVCGLNNETNILLKERLQDAAAEKGLKLQIISRYRKEGVYQYVMEHPDYQCVILQEILQSSSPYTAEDVALLTDERNIRVIIVLSKNHIGNRYMRVLYAAGILDALYEEDAYAEKIVSLLFHGRSRKEARKYYGIETVADVEKSMQIIDEERLKSFLSYIEGGGPFRETIDRYEFVATRMTAAENLHLIKNMDSGLAKALLESELFQYYNGYLIGKSKKRFSFWWRKEKEPLEPEAVLSGKKDEIVIEYGSEKSRTDSYMESLSRDGLMSDSSIMPEAEDSEAASVNKEGFDSVKISHEEESLFDLFGEEEHTSILDFIEEEDSSRKLPEKINLNEKEIPSVEGERSEEKRYIFKANRKLVLAAGVAIICMALFLFCFIEIYSEKEIPMIEEIPVSTKAEEEELPAAKALQEEAAAEDIAIPEKQVDFSEMAEEAYEEEGEDQDVQEETKENEPQGAAKVAEKSDTTKESVSSDKPDSQHKTASSERTEASAAGEASDAVAGIQEPDVDISKEAIVGERKESEGLEDSQEQNLQDCNGKIFSGDELEGLAASLQQNGFQVYIVTRENGEGYFSAGEIREKCEAACSFLASVNGGEVKLVEQ